MSLESLQDACELGQRQLMATEYLDAAQTLGHAATLALQSSDFDTLARLYMPLQETRRQIRQRCGEGIVHMRLLASGPDDQPDPERIINQYPHAQLLVAGWKSIAPARAVRRLAAERKLYVETFLAAVYPVGPSRLIAIVPTADIPLPDIKVGSPEGLLAALPHHSLVLHEEDLLPSPQPGTPKTYAVVMDLWERLHRPWLADADAQSDPMLKIEGYRHTLEVDYACEFAHQRLSGVAHELCRRRRSRH